MKLLWTLSIVWSLCCTASALRCVTQTCTNSVCTSTSTPTCSTSQSCITASMDSGLSRIEHRGCVPNSVCLTMGTATISANLGRGTGIVSTYCCNSGDSCNAGTLAVPSWSGQTLNGRQCVTCDEQTNTVCNLTLSCVGDQDSCVSGTVFSSPTRKTYGCASSNFVSFASRLSVLSPLSSLASFTEGPTACSDKDFCNSASTLKTLGVAVPLVLSVVAVILSS